LQQGSFGSLFTRALSLMLAATLWVSLGGMQTHAAERRKVVVASNFGAGSTQGQGVIDVTEAFQEAHPEIEIELLMGFAEDKYLTSVASGTAPDVYTAGDARIKGYVLEGLAADITRFVDSDTRLSADDFWPPAWSRVRHAGRIWGLPYSADPNFALAINTSHFAEVGLDSSDPVPTIADVDAAHMRLTRATSDRLERIGIVPWDMPAGPLGGAIFTWGWTFGGSFYDEESGKITPLDPGIVAATEWMLSHDERNPQEVILAATAPNLNRRFALGQVSMQPLNPPILTNVLRTAPDLDVEILPMPRYPGGPENTMWIGGHTFFVSAGSEQKEAAYEYIRYAAGTPEGSGRLLGPAGFFPAYRHSKAYEQLLEIEWNRQFVALQSTAVLERASIPAVREYGEAFKAALDKVLDRTLAPREALAEVERLVQPVVTSALEQAKL